MKLNFGLNIASLRWNVKCNSLTLNTYKPINAVSGLVFVNGYFIVSISGFGGQNSKAPISMAPLILLFLKVMS